MDFLKWVTKPFKPNKSPPSRPSLEERYHRKEAQATTQSRKLAEYFKEHGSLPGKETEERQWLQEYLDDHSKFHDSQMVTGKRKFIHRYHLMYPTFCEVDEFLNDNIGRDIWLPQYMQER